MASLNLRPPLEFIYNDDTKSSAGIEFPKWIVKLLEQIFKHNSIFGPPKELLSDQGKEFLNKTVSHLTKLIGIEHKITSSYHPRTNGLVERFNQTLIQSLKKHCDNDITNWPKYLPFTLMAYRTKVHATTNYSPFEILFGRKMNGFHNWTNQPSCDDASSIYQRTLEIKK